MGSKRTTMDDIAKALGISKNAVSLALRGKEGVSEQLRSRVVEAAVSMKYPGLVQQPVEQYILALIPRYLGTMEDSAFYQQVCFHMEAYAQSRGYQLIISSVSEAEEEALAHPPLLDNIACVGVMTIGNLSLPYCRMISRLGLRYLMVDQYYDELVANSVTTTNTSGAYMLTKHLIENGHTKIDYFGKRYTTASLNDRWTGYSRAMTDFDLVPRRNLYMQDRTSGQLDERILIKDAFEAMDTLPTAVFCGHDNTARAVIDVLDGMGVKYPDDISVVGFDDIQLAQVQALGLTTYHTRKADIAHGAIDLFIEARDDICRRVLIYGEIIYRDSVRDIRPR